MKKTTKFRELINAPKITIMPGTQDALTACIAEKTGFEVITCGGYSSTAALLGQPDTSQLSMTEMAEHYARICDNVNIPVFGDGDTGFGNVTNVRRTIQRYEASGLAGMFIEDQAFPKRCGINLKLDCLAGLRFSRAGSLLYRRMFFAIRHSLESA